MNPLVMQGITVFIDQFGQRVIMNIDQIGQRGDNDERSP